jgi:hypothetical protein
VYVLIAFFIAFIGGIAWYINWEKRVIARSERYKKVGKKLERIENALKEYAKQDPTFAEILKEEGLMQN